MQQATYEYKNISGQDLEVIGVGFVKAGEVITTHDILNSPNLELVNHGPQKEEKAEVETDTQTPRAEGRRKSSNK